MMGSLRLIFMGSPEFSVTSLAALIEAGHQIVCIYSQPPRPAGRGHRKKPCPVHRFALDHGLPVKTPKSLKDGHEQDAFRAFNADACVVAAYGLILPKAILEAPRLGCLNVHASLLPRWRGAAPIQRAIMAGDAKTGVTIMQMDQGLDTGDILLQGETAITATTTASDLHDRLAEIGAGLIIQALTGRDGGNLNGLAQGQDGITYAAKLGRQEGRIDWALPADQLERRVRALNPWPGVWFEHNGRRIKVLAAAVNAQQGPAGKVLDNLLTIACGQASLRLTRVQAAGRSAAAAADFLRGYDLKIGADIN